MTCEQLRALEACASDRTWWAKVANVAGLRDTADIEDAIQAALEAMLRYCPADLAPANVERYFAKVLRRKCGDIHRLHTRVVPSETIESLAGAAPEGHRVEALEMLGLLGSLRSSTRRTALLEQWAGFSVRETMERHRWSERKARRALDKGRRQIRTLAGVSA